MEDLNRMLNNEKTWLLTIMAASGALEPSYPTQFHFTYGAKKGDETYDDPNITLNDVSTFDTLYKEFAGLLENKYQLSADLQRYHNNSSPAYFARHLENKVNAVAIRIAWSVICSDTRAILIAKELANTINHNINNIDNPDIPELQIKNIGYEDYKE